MRYFGGKQRIAKHIVPTLEQYRKTNQIYFEPFVGGASIVSKIKGIRIASDIHKDLILLYQEMKQNIFTFPENVDEELYKNLKNNSPSSLRGFVGFGCSFAGKWFGGFARGKNRNYAQDAKNSLLKKSITWNEIEFYNKDYREWHPNNMLIYCDPPYKNHTKISNIKFNHEEFWNIMRIWSNTNTVIISEYDAPVDFKCILEIKTHTEIRNNHNQRIKRTEKLYISTIRTDLPSSVESQSNMNHHNIT